MTMFWVGISAVAVSAIGIGVSAYGQVAAGENQKETADYNAKVASNAALDAQNRGAQAAAEHNDKVRRMMGTQIATMGANGLLSNTGTNLDILTDTAGMGKLDALRLLNNAGRTAQGYNDQAGLLQIQGENALTAGQLNAGGAILGGASSASNSYFSNKANAAYAAANAPT